MAEILSWQTDDELRESYVRLCDRIVTVDDSLRVFVPGTHCKNQVLERIDQLLAHFSSSTPRPPLFGVSLRVRYSSLRRLYHMLRQRFATGIVPGTSIHLQTLWD